MIEFEPSLTEWNQVFSPEMQKEVESTDKATSFPSSWGQDRFVSLQSRDTPVKSQWNGTCTSFATIAAIENLLGGHIHLSERTLWDCYGIFSLDQALLAAKVHHIIEEKYWPRSEQTFSRAHRNKGRCRLSVATKIGASFIKVIQAIDAGYPCVVAMNTPRDLALGKEYIESDSLVSVKSGHAMCVSGYKVTDGKCYFLVKNSWGEGMGKDGYQFIDFDIFRKSGVYGYFIAIEKVEDRGEPHVGFINDIYLDKWQFKL